VSAHDENFGDLGIAGVILALCWRQRGVCTAKGRRNIASARKAKKIGPRKRARRKGMVATDEELGSQAGAKF